MCAQDVFEVRQVFNLAYIVNDLTHYWARTSDPQSSFLAARYLTHALQLGSLGKSTGVLACLSLDIAQSLFDHYSKKVAETPSIIEWSNFDKFLCAAKLHQAGIYDAGIYDILGDLAAHILR